MKKVAVVGGGPAGMMTAIIAAKYGNVVTLFEKNKACGKKLSITGKGRCNLTNCSTPAELINQITVNGKFLHSAFFHFDAEDLMAFFTDQGVPLKVERGRRVFPVSDRAKDIVNTMVKLIESSKNIRLILNSEVQKIQQAENAVFELLANGILYKFDAVVIATGGLSYPMTGSTGDGYKFANAFRHRIVPLIPSLVPLVSHNPVCNRLCGLSLKNVRVTLLAQKNTVLFSDIGEMIFTHFGVSGPLVLSASAHMRNNNKNCEISIDLKPGLSYQELDARILRDFAKNTNKNFENALSDLLPKSMIPVIVERSAISPYQKIHQVTKEQRKRLCQLIKEFQIPIAGFRPIEEAIVTSGGVDTSEISPKTMESKIVQGLYFVGEVLDVDAYTGGYNLQIAFSTGYTAGISI